MTKKGLVLLFFVIFILGSFGAGFYFGQLQVPPPPIEGVSNQELGQPEEVDFSGAG